LNSAGERNFLRGLGIDTNTAQTTTSSKWNGKKLGVIGDSITELVPGNATIPYHKYVGDKLGLTVTNYGISSTGWNTDYLPFRDRVAGMANDLDLITVFGGTNDWDWPTFPIGTFGDTTTATIYGAIDDLLKRLMNKYPTKTIACFTPTPSSKIFSSPKASEQTQIVDAIIKVCGYYSIPCLDLFRNSGIYAFNSTSVAQYMPDGLHLNNAGHALIGDKILKFCESL
jgi:lysophospholipase L1-like esterase